MEYLNYLPLPCVTAAPYPIVHSLSSTSCSALSWWWWYCYPTASLSSTASRPHHSCWVHVGEGYIRGFFSRWWMISHCGQTIFLSSILPPQNHPPSKQHWRRSGQRGGNQSCHDPNYLTNEQRCSWMRVCKWYHSRKIIRMTYDVP